MDMDNTTIAAISTPRGTGGLAIVRMSGPEALSLLQSVFRPSGKSAWESHRLSHGWIYEESKPVDEVVVGLYLAPRSCTGEDVVEISCHGGRYVSRKILDLLITQGAFPAQPGEFTQRAFLNGRMDLTQAEAVADLIQAGTQTAHRVAASQLKGKLSERLNQYRQRLIEYCALLELELDFSDEEVEFAGRDQLKTNLDEISNEISRLVSTFQKGRMIREGVTLAIAGLPNVGKSTLLNQLLKHDRAIVTPEPGTTRDTLEESIELEGLLFRLIDTAGIRDTEDPAEQEGVRRAWSALESSDLVLLVLDISKPLSVEDRKLIQKLDSLNKPFVITLNKNDLEAKWDERAITREFDPDRICRISALQSRGIKELESMLVKQALLGEEVDENEVVLTRMRHRQCAAEALDHLEKASASLEQGMSQEFVALDMRGAMSALESLTGKISTDDILEHIFSRFCIGK